MKYLKLIVIAVAATAVLAAVGAGAAAAETVLCTETATPCPAAKADGEGTEIKASLVSGTKSKITTNFEKTIECGKSSLTVKVTGGGEKVNANVEGMSFEECNCTVNVLKKGTLELEYVKGTDNATVKSTGTEITANCLTIFGTIHCIYKTEATDLGTLEGGNPAKLKVSAELPRLTTNAICNEKSLWEAEYEVSSPKPLYVEPSVVKETVLCTETATPCPAGKADGFGTEIKASLVSGTKSKITNVWKNIECSKSTLNAKVTGGGEKINTNVEGLTFEECNCEVKVLSKGTVSLEHLNGTDNATIRSSSAEVTSTCLTIAGTAHCIYKTEATDLGTLEGGNPAKLKVSVELPRLSTSALCEDGALWEAEYEVSSPKPLYVEPY